MAATACTIHALPDTIPCDCSAVQIACMLSTAVGMKDSTAQSRIRSHCVVQCLNAQLRLHVCTHSNTQNTQIEAVEYDGSVELSIFCFNLCNIHNAFFKWQASGQRKSRLACSRYFLQDMFLFFCSSFSTVSEAV